MSKIKILENVSIDKIKPYEKNYQKHDDNIEHIKNSIKDFDFDVPIVVDVNNVIVKGHGRYEALKELGKDIIPLVAINMSLDTKKKASAARIADNQSSKAAVVDNDILKFELDLIGEDFEIEDYGLDLGNFDIDVDNLTDTFTLDSSEKPPFQTVTFTLSDEQMQELQEALKEIKATDEFKYVETYGNENGNGNALYLMVTQWQAQKK